MSNITFCSLSLFWASLHILKLKAYISTSTYSIRTCSSRTSSSSCQQYCPQIRYRIRQAVLTPQRDVFRQLLLASSALCIQAGPLLAIRYSDRFKTSWTSCGHRPLHAPTFRVSLRVLVLAQSALLHARSFRPSCASAFKRPHISRTAERSAYRSRTFVADLVPFKILLSACGYLRSFARSARVCAAASFEALCGLVFLCL